MRQHGIARTAGFTLVEQGDDACRLRLAADAVTRQAFPYDFVLDLDYRITGATLGITGTVRNAGDAVMPVSFGFHPAFRWPLPYGASAADHAIVFAAEEPRPLASLAGGLLSGETRPSPVRGRDARARAASLRRRCPDLPRSGEPFRRLRARRRPQAAHRLRWNAATRHLVQTRRPVRLHRAVVRLRSPADFDGDATRKPGTTLVAPGESRSFGMQVSLTAA